MIQAIRRNIIFVLTCIIAIGGYGFFVFAAPPGSGGYNPGETLNPECAPGDTVPEPCIVQLPSGSSSGWSLSGNTVTGGVAASIDTVFNGVGLNDITMTGPYTGTTTQTWVIVITATGTPDQMEVIIDGDSEYVGDVFPPGPLPVDDGLTLNFGSDTGHTIGDSWEFTMTPASGGTTAFLGTLNNEDLIFKTNNIERMRLLSNGDISLVQYQSPRDDSGSYSPINFLYTDGDGNLMSAPTSLLGGGSFSLKSSDEGSTLTNDTIAFDFTGAGVTATESGGLVTVNISGGGGGSDENIYDNDGTLAGNRTLTGANNNLVFNGVNQFAAVTTTNLAGSIIRNISSTEGTFSSFAAYPKSAKQHLSGISADPSFSAGWPAEFMLYDAHDSGLGGGLLEFSGLGIDTDTGITFYSNGGNQYSFPKTDGSAGQTLVTDGSGQLSWETPAGGTSLQWYAENAAAPTTAPVATGAGSIALGNRAQALAQDMFVYGDLAGNGATNATYSNFLGANAGTSATDASFSNFIGIGTGNGATNASSSNFIGRNAGSLATDAVDSNFFGTNAGDSAANAEFSNFFGRFAGSGATDATFSNFFGRSAGLNAANASLSNFFGYRAGQSATDAGGSNFFGYSAGEAATNASLSNFIGYSAGLNATNAANSIFIGQYAGNGDSVNNTGNVNDFSILIGKSTSTGGFENSIAIGGSATNTASNQLQIGSTTRPITSVFIGDSKGTASTDGTFFVGFEAGQNATFANNSNFIGNSAGKQATNAHSSNFFGEIAGQGATNAYSSSFLSSGAGYNATNANSSNFIGYTSGSYATNASYSNFIGSSAGGSATNASNSIFIGYQSGNTDSVDNTNDAENFSILIGSITSTGGFSNSIALGQRATNTASNQFMIGSTTRPIDETKIIGSLGTECTITTGTGMACTSDERLKTNITDLNSDTLSKLQNVRTVAYNWLQNPNSPTQIGFLAQNLEQYFPEMVMTDANGKKQVYYSQMTPILVEAIREMNLNVTMLSDMTRENTWRDALIAWFGNATNGIENFIAGTIRARNQVCIDDVCINKEQLQSIMQNNGIVSQPSPVISTPPPTDDPVIDNTTDDTVTDPDTDMNTPSEEPPVSTEDTNSTENTEPSTTE